MKKLSLAQMEKLQGGKFMGTGTNCYTEPGWGIYCRQKCYHTLYVFWIAIDSWTSEKDVPCPIFYDIPF